MATSYDDALPKHHEATQSEKLVITASSLGTVFEWYDFYLYGLLGSRPSRWCNFGCGRGPSSGGFGGDV